MSAVGVFFTGKEQVEVRPLPAERPGPDQVLIETHRSLISTGTEGICYARRFAPGSHWDNWVKYPFPVGYSAAGRVLEAGPGVTHLKPGDRAAGLGFHHARTLMPAFAAFPIPEGVSDEEATWGTLAYITQHGFRKAKLALGETVVVVGVGLLGQLVVQYARAAGAGEVIAIDPAAQRLAWAASHGATHTLAVGVEEAADAVGRLTGGQMAEVVFDMTGHARVFAAATRLLRRFGRLVLIGDTGTPADQHLTSEVIRRDLRVIAAHAANSPNAATDEAPWSKRAMVALFYKMLLQGRMRVKDLTTHRYRVEDAAEAFAMLHRDRDRDGAMGVIFEYGE